MNPTQTTSAARVAVVTGASSGIGAATARALAGAGFSVVIGARRRDRLAAVAAACGARALPLDVIDPESVAAFAAALPETVHLLDEDKWLWMYQANVLGTLRVTQALLPRLLASGDGHVVNVGSIAGFETYANGAGYTGAKHALRAFTRTLRIELLGKPVRVTEVDPGLVETEFSSVRFAGDEERAAAVYRGLTPLSADDVADCILWAASRPPHVNIDEIVVRPRDQATAQLVHRRPT
jgi:NADP-dependent 3-hydroxy acid dehydrogenase YdfG